MVPARKRHNGGQTLSILVATGVAWTSSAPAPRVMSLGSHWERHGNATGTPRERVVSVGKAVECTAETKCGESARVEPRF